MKKILVIIPIAALLLSASAYAFTVGLYAQQTFTVGSNLQATALEYAYDAPTLTSWSSYVQCTQGSAWSCPTPTHDIFAGDNITYTFVTETDEPSLASSMNVTAGAFTAYSVNFYYQTLSGPLSSNPVYTDTMQTGLPTMLSGQWFQIWAVITIAQGAPTGSVTFTLSFGA